MRNDLSYEHFCPQRKQRTIDQKSNKTVDVTGFAKVRSTTTRDSSKSIRKIAPAGSRRFSTPREGRGGSGGRGGERGEEEDFSAGAMPVPNTGDTQRPTSYWLAGLAIDWFSAPLSSPSVPSLPANCHAF